MELNKSPSSRSGLKHGHSKYPQWPAISPLYPHCGHLENAHWTTRSHQIYQRISTRIVSPIVFSFLRSFVPPDTLQFRLKPDALRGGKGAVSGGLPASRHPYRRCGARLAARTGRLCIEEEKTINRKVINNRQGDTI